MSRKRAQTRVGRAMTCLQPQTRVLRWGLICALGAAVLFAIAYGDDGIAKATSVDSRRPALTHGIQPGPLHEMAAWPPPVVEDTQADPAQWIYPLSGVSAKWETTRMGSFGAKRPGHRPSECRRGHCGVDLHGPRGMPIVAVRAGIVERVHRSRRGKAGRYVALLHDDGSRTYYMHLDRTRRDLSAGDQVAAGEAVGTLGRTGVRRSPPHLHFAWKVARGKWTAYRNPARRLAAARVIESPLSTTGDDD